MKKIFFALIGILFFQQISAQKIVENIRGRVLLDATPLAGVHVHNLHNESYTITDEHGYFTIRAVVGNTLQLTHVGLQTAFRTIIKEDFEFAGVEIQMKEQITELEGVEVSKYQKITAQDLGILQHKPVERTFAEKRVYSSGGFGILALVDVITGRRKMLKKVVMNEKNTAIAMYIQENMGDFLKKELKITDEEVQFLSYYVMENPEIQNLVKSKDEKTLQFMLIDAWRESQQNLEKDE